MPARCWFAILLFTCLAPTLPGAALAEFKDKGYFDERERVGGDSAFTARLRTGRAYDLPVMQAEHFAITGLGKGTGKSLVLDTLPFDAAEKIFGPAPIINIDGVTRYLRCYTSTQPDDRTAVLVNPSMGGTLGGMTILADKGQVQQQGLCRGSEVVHSGLATKSGLRLGMTRPEVEALLGPPHGLRKNKLLYSAWDRDLTPAERKAIGMTDTSGKSMSLLRSITVWLDRHGRVNAFDVLQVTTPEGW